LLLPIPSPLARIDLCHRRLRQLVTKLRTVTEAVTRRPAPLPCGCTCCTRRRCAGSTYLMPPSPRSGAWWWRTRGGRRARRHRGGGAPRSPVDRAASGRLPRAPELGGSILEEEGERSDLEEEELLGRAASPPRPSVPRSAASLEKRGERHCGEEQGGMAEEKRGSELGGETRERRHAVRMGAAAT
jgi:hypothetical protein